MSHPKTGLIQKPRKHRRPAIAESRVGDTETAPRRRRRSVASKTTRERPTGPVSTRNEPTKSGKTKAAVAARRNGTSTRRAARSSATRKKRAPCTRTATGSSRAFQNG
jgi:hypothetical protein